MSVHDYSVKSASGEHVSLADYAGTTLLIVNTASKCGLTPQYEGLEELQREFGNDNFTVLGFPCNQFGGQEPGSNEDIQQFCAMSFGTTFPVMAKIDVNGRNADPLYKYLKKQKSGLLGGTIKWNFTKFLVDGEGNVVERYAPSDEPATIAPAIRDLLAVKA